VLLAGMLDWRQPDLSWPVSCIAAPIAQSTLVVQTHWQLLCALRVASTTLADGGCETPASTALGMHGVLLGFGGGVLRGQQTA
jgi:hypothetical protein